MLKKYYPDDIPFENTHTVELTYLIGTNKLVLRGKIKGDCQGANALNSFSDEDGTSIDETLEVIEGYFKYDGEYETVEVKIDGDFMELSAREFQNYLIKAEIIDVKFDEDEY